MANSSDRDDGTDEIVAAALVGIVLLVVTTIVIGLTQRKATLPML